MDAWDLKPKKKKKKQRIIDDQTLDTPSSTFSSSVVSLQIGNPPQVFRLHSDVLTQSTLLGSTDHVYTDDDPLCVSAISPPIFDLVVRYLYGIPFEKWKHMLVPAAGFFYQVEDLLLPTCEMLCFASKYGLSELEDILFANMQQIPNINFQSVLAAARYVYTYASEVNARFRTFFIEETQKALADPELSNQAWFVATFDQGYNGLTREIFNCYKNMYSLPKSVDPQISKIAGMNDMIMPLPSTEDHQSSRTERQQITSSEHGSDIDDNVLSVASSISDPDKTRIEEGLPATNHREDWTNVDTLEDTNLSVKDQPTSLMPEPEPEPLLKYNSEIPWDFGLKSKERNMKRKEMEAHGVKFDYWGDPIYSRPVTEVAANCELESHPLGAEKPSEDSKSGIDDQPRCSGVKPNSVSPIIEQELADRQTTETMQPVEAGDEVDIWAFPSPRSNRKDKKLKKKRRERATAIGEFPPPVEVESQIKEDFDWGFGNFAAKDNNDKALADKSDMKIIPEPEEPVEDNPEKDGLCSNWTTSSEKTKSEKDSPKHAAEQHSGTEQAKATKMDDFWTGWGLSKRASSKVAPPEEGISTTNLRGDLTYEVALRYDAQNYCEQRQYHLGKTSRWSKCGECTDEVVTMIESVSRNCTYG